MTDQSPVDQGNAASASAPGTIAQADIDKITAQLNGQWEQRFRDLQSKVIAPKDDMISALTQEVRQLKTAGLSEEEREQLAAQERDQELEMLRAQNELLRLSQEYGAEASFFSRLLDAPDTKSQLDIMREFAKSVSGQQTPAAGASGASSVEIPDVDPNRPAAGGTPQNGQLLPDGTVMTDELADAVLKGFQGPLAAITQQRIVPTK